MSRGGERLFAWLLRLYPRAFRELYGDDLHAFLRQDRAHPKYGRGALRSVRFWFATTEDLMRTAWNLRRADRQASHGPSPATARPSGRWRRDVRLAWRGLWSAPRVTIAALAVLTLGIGASTAIFSLVDAVVLRGLPYPNDHELVSMATGGASGRTRPVRPQDYDEWRRRQQAFVALGASTGAGRLILAEDPSVRLNGARITPSLLEVLRATPALGRPFTEADAQPGSRPVALLSDAMWRGHLGANPAVVGRTLLLKSGPVEIVGVMPADFRYPVTTSADVWVPFVPTPDLTIRGKSRIYMLSVVARLWPTLTVEQAAAHMASLQEALAVEDPSWFKDHPIVVRRWRDALVNAAVQSWMMLLLGAVAGVLLIACLNVANLLVARAVARTPELAIRTALGARRWDLARALLIESVLLSLLGAAGGVLLAIWGVDVLRATLPATLPRLATVAVDFRVTAVAVGAALVTGLAFGLLPALQASRRDLVTLVGSGTRAHAGGRTSRRIRMSLVVAEVAVASVLLVGTGMFVSSFVRVTSIDLGFDPRHVIALTGATLSSTAIRPATTPERQKEATSGQTLIMNALERLRAVPDVVAVAALGGGRPLGGSFMSVSLERVGAATGVDEGAPKEPIVRSVTPGYLDVLRGTLMRGRWIADTDLLGSEPVIVLSDETVRTHFGGDDPIGQRVRLDGYERTVIGVVRPMRFRGPESDTGLEAFVPLRQGSYASAELLVRTRSDPTARIPALHAAIRSAMSTAMLEALPLEADYAGFLAQRKFNMVVLVIFGLVALIVAALGIYGLMAYLVEQRRREMGVRVALGAGPSGILWLVLSGATKLMIAGLAIGTAAAVLFEHLVRAFLFEPQPRDPVVYATAALALFATGLVAAFGPARRAALVDPLLALRSE